MIHRPTPSEPLNPLRTPSSQHLSEDSTSGEVLATQVEWIIPILGLWAGVGLAAAVLMRRRGHEFPPAVVMGVVFGPLFLPLARRDMRSHHPGERAIVIEAAPQPRTSFDVLLSADLDATDLGIAGAIAVHAGEGYGRLMIAAAIDYESAESGVLSLRARRTAHRLEIASMTSDRNHPTGRVLIAGPHPEALVAYATRNRYEVVVLASDARHVHVQQDGPVVIRTIGETS